MLPMTTSYSLVFIAFSLACFVARYSRAYCCLIFRVLMSLLVLVVPTVGPQAGHAQHVEAAAVVVGVRHPGRPRQAGQPPRDPLRRPAALADLVPVHASRATVVVDDIVGCRAEEILAAPLASQTAHLRSPFPFVVVSLSITIAPSREKTRALRKIFPGKRNGPSGGDEVPLGPDARPGVL